MMKRREFMSMLGCAATVWPLTARAQQPSRVRRIGVLVNLAADDSETQARVGAFLQGLQGFGWEIGGNARFEYRWAPDADSIRKHAVEITALAPDVILAIANPTVLALQQATRTLPIVFVAVTDPVAGGATLGVRDCRRGVSVPARSLLAASILPESLTDRAVEIIDLFPR